MVADSVESNLPATSVKLACTSVATKEFPELSVDIALASWASVVSFKWALRSVVF